MIGIWEVEVDLLDEIKIFQYMDRGLCLVL